MSNQENKKFLDLDGLRFFWTDIKSRLNAINSHLDFLKSVESGLTSISGLNPNKRLHVANLDTDANLSVSSLPAAGRDIHIIVKNVSTANSIDVNIPGDSYYVRICDPVYTIKPGEYLEVNIISDGGSAYIRIAEQN